MSHSSWDRLQQQGIAKLKQHLQQYDSVCGVAPTGFGKTRVSQLLIHEWQSAGVPWVFYTHRKTLFKQTHEAFLKHGIVHGCRAAGYSHLEAPGSLGQLAMIPSEQAALRSGKRQLHMAARVIIDEWHCSKNGFAEEVCRYHLANGAKVVGFTATPIGLGHIAQSLCIMANNSELRAVGGIVPCITYAPDEVDMSDVKRMSATGEFNQAEMGKRFAIQQVVDSVIDRWKALNPNGAPTLLFAPGVKESIWFADQFLQNGIPAAHIDGENVYLGERDSQGNHVIHKSVQSVRDQLADMSKSGKVQVVCNRFVMREGVDWPWLEHGIWACALGTEEGWVQSGGRILRAAPGLKQVVIQDHGGNFHRHGSLNADRVWKLGDTRQSREKADRHAKESGQKDQGMVCPSCRRVCTTPQWQIKKCCPFCGFKFQASVRMVIQTGGKLKRMHGNPVKVKRVYAEAQKAWDSVYYPAKNSKRQRASTFRQAVARFHREFPRYKIDVTGSVTTIVDSYTGKVAPLHNVPSPKDVTAWGKQVREVSNRDLQDI